MKTVVLLNSHKVLRWKYTQDKQIFSDPSVNRIVFLGNFQKLEKKKLGWMMRNFLKDLKLNHDIAEISFSGTSSGLVQSACFL